MRKYLKDFHGLRYGIFLLVISCSNPLSAQTDLDGIMMAKNNLCTGLMYSSSQWSNYWEGTYKRDNQNLGTVSTKMYGLMGNYGLSDKVNLVFGIPYVQTNASEGTLHGLKGIQDLSLMLKWNPVNLTMGKGEISFYGVGGFSFPTSNYVADFLPLSIGLHSTNFTARVISDYQAGRFFATLSAAYILRSNIHLDRDSYYTTEQHLTNEVAMPDAANYQLRTGYRSGRLTAEIILTNWTTLGGFDITRNNMPFPSNRMNATTTGVNMKYNVHGIDGLSLIGGGSITLAGRNVGQASTINGGIFYIFDFTRKVKKSKPRVTKISDKI